jgi:hypothetical protein
MRIEGQSGESLSNVYLWLTPDEAKELMDTLEQLLRDGDYTAHHHTSSADFQTEVTVMLDRA